MPRIRYRPPPMIIRIIKKNDEYEHHNSGWKVAYADMMTAMMAFFLLLWIYSTLNPQKKDDIANYFTPTIGIIGESGVGIKGGKEEIADKGKSVQSESAEGIVKNQLRQGPVPVAQDTPTINTKDAGSTILDEEENRQRWQREFMPIQNDIKQMMQKDRDPNLQNTVLMEKTKDGLKINLITDPKSPIFVPLSATLTAQGTRLLTDLTNIIAKSQHAVSITGHLANNGAIDSPEHSKWELSMERAQAVQRLLVSTKLEPNCIMRVAGEADQELMFSEEPDSVRNNRIEIVILTNDCFPSPK